MGGVIQTAIAEDGTPYFVDETLKLIKDLKNNYLPLVTNWIQSAHEVLLKDEMLYQETFNNVDFETTKINGKSVRTGQYTILSQKSGVGFTSEASGGRNTGVTLATQWESIVRTSQRSKSRDVGNELINRTLLTRGYYILTKIGERIRGDTVNYKIILHTTSNGVMSKAVEWNLNLLEFLNEATHQSVLNNQKAYYSTGITSLEKMQSRLGDGTPWKEEEVDDFNLFLQQVLGFVQLKGLKREHPLGDEVKTVNMGQLLEAYLQLGFIYKYRPRGDKAAWLELKQQLEAVISVLGTLSKPSAFWQGGEGGEKLKNTQLKTNGASITNMTSLVRQMTRVYSIISQLPIKIGQRVRKQTLDASLQFSDDEALNALIIMFEREGWKDYSVTVNI